LVFNGWPCEALFVFWPSLTSAEQTIIEEIGVRRSFEPGSRLLDDGESATSILVILSGQAKLTRTSFDGHTVVIELRGPGALLGELAVLDEGRRIATVVAVTEVEGLVVPASRFRELLLGHPRICFAVLLTVSDKLRQATAWRTVASSTDVLTRLATRLVELIGEHSSTDEVIDIDSPFTQQELADWIGVSRDAVVLALGTMRSRGWIETGRRTIRILDVAALRSVADRAV